MNKTAIFLVVIYSAIFHYACCQNIDMSDYNGEWQSAIDPIALSYSFSIDVLENDSYRVSLSNSNEVFNKEIVSTSQDKIELTFLGVCSFIGRIHNEDKKIEGFLKIRDSAFHLLLSESGKDTYTGQWNSFYVNVLNPARVYLAVENGKGDSYEAYPVFPDNRYRGTYAADFQKNGDEISFVDRRSGHSFEGKLLEDKIKLDVMLGTARVTSLEFTRSRESWELGTKATSKSGNATNPLDKNDGIEVGAIMSITQDVSGLDRMKDSIEAGSLTNVHSLLIAYRDKLIYEEYYNGFYAELLHDTRSAAKSIASATIGIAIEDGLIDSVNANIFSYLPEEYQYTKSPQKKAITLHHLLTMSSGIDAIDFGIDRQSIANEDNYQQSDDWLKTVLEAPMIFEAGEHSNYGSANPYLLGVALAEQMDQPVEEYMHDKLYHPLGISNYSMPLDDRGDVYFGGGSYFTPRDLLKFGFLYANKGKWKDNQIIPQKWVAASSKNYKILENTTEKNGYGYLFWHEEYEVKGKKINSLEARGAGGQLIAIIHELDLVIVMNSGNYRNGRYWQPQLMMKEYILPCLVK